MEGFQKIFLAEFGAAGTMIKDETCLFEMRKKIGKNISSYITRFKKELDSVEVIEEKSVIMCFIGGLYSGPLKIKLMLRGPKNMVDMFLVAQKMASAEENKKDHGKNYRSRRGKDRVDDDQNDKKDVSKNTQRGRRTDTRRNDRGGNGQARVENFTPLNATREHIMNVFMRNNQLEPPRPLNPKNS